MEKMQIPLVAREQLANYLEMSGAILYSSHQTLQKGDIYLLGFNPGGGEDEPLAKAIDGMLSATGNAYLDQDWSGPRRTYGKGGAPLQKRVSWLLDALGYEPGRVCASNLIFMRSRSSAMIPFDYADICWPVHQAVLDVVRPKLILAFGNSARSPYAYLKGRFGDSREDEIHAGHGNWKVKGCSLLVREGQRIYLAALPHLSYYSPIGKADIVAWLKGKLQDAELPAAGAVDG